MRRDDLYFVVKQQNDVITMLSGIIDDIFRLLLQHVDADDAGVIAATDKIREAAIIRESIGGDAL